MNTNPSCQGQQEKKRVKNSVVPCQGGAERDRNQSSGVRPGAEYTPPMLQQYDNPTSALTQNSQYSRFLAVILPRINQWAQA